MGLISSHFLKLFKLKLMKYLTVKMGGDLISDGWTGDQIETQNQFSLKILIVKRVMNKFEI